MHTRMGKNSRKVTKNIENNINKKNKKKTKILKKWEKLRIYKNEIQPKKLFVQKVRAQSSHILRQSKHKDDFHIACCLATATAGIKSEQIFCLLLRFDWLVRLF